MGDIKPRRGSGSYNHSSRARQPTTFMDPDEYGWFTNSNPPRDPSSRNPFATGMPATGALPMPAFYTPKTDPHFNNFVQEATLISCSFCMTLHQGPHCYKGSCHAVETINSDSQEPTTMAICEQCFGRHIPADYLMHVQRGTVVCKLCQKRHRHPVCQEGTCTEAKNEPYICDIDHRNFDCRNSVCNLFMIDHARYVKDTPTKSICHRCGARHLDQEHTSPPPPTVTCEQCRTRHVFPECMSGSSCTNLQRIVTPYVNSEGFPTKFPHTRYKCGHCHRRHAEHPYLNPSERMGQLIACYPCGKSHPAPACYEGSCDMPIAKAITKDDPKIDTKFLCHICGRRHKTSPQQVTEQGIADSLGSFNCHACRHCHAPGRCIGIKECSQVDPRVSNGARTTTKLPCSNCDLRHADQTVLALRTNPGAYSGVRTVREIEYGIGELTPPNYKTLPKRPQTPDIETQVVAPKKVKFNSNTRNGKPFATYKYDHRCYKGVCGLYRHVRDDNKPRSEYPTYKDWIRPQPMALCNTCGHIHNKPSCKPMFNDLTIDFIFCSRCRNTHAKPPCRGPGPECTYCPSLTNRSSNQSAICRSCHNRHIDNRELAHTLSFRDWQDTIKHPNPRNVRHPNRLPLTTVPVVSPSRLNAWIEKLKQLSISPREFVPFAFFLVTSLSLRYLV